MVSSCCAYGCTNRYKKGENIRFHTFPFKNEILMKKWLQKIRRKNFTPTKNTVICSQHFHDSDYQVRPNTSKVKLKPDAFPSIFTGFPHYYQPKLKRSKVSVVDKEGEKAAVKCSFHKDVATEIECSSDERTTTECGFNKQLNSEAVISGSDQPSNLFRDVTVQTEISSCDVGVQTELIPELSSPQKERILTLQKKVKVLNQKIRRLQKRLHNQYINLTN